MEMEHITQVTLPYAKFLEIAELEFNEVTEVTVSLGCAEFARRDIPDEAGAFAVHLQLRLSNGRFLGNGAYSGMVYGFDQDVLEQLWEAAGKTLDEDTLYKQVFNVSEGDWLDPNSGSPVCSECLAANGEWNDPASSVYDPESDEYDPDAPASCAPYPKKGSLCWSCKQMVSESLYKLEPATV